MLEKRREEQAASRVKASSRRSKTQDKSSEKHKEDLLARVKSFFKL